MADRALLSERSPTCRAKLVKREYESDAVRCSIKEIIVLHQVLKIRDIKMPENADRFNKNTIDSLAKRSANICSNPDCRAITSGPAEDADRSISVGEAAHIYGANPGSARHDSKMTSPERSAITNAIWLCRNCHKIVDADPNQYPAALLFEWRKDHEVDISERVGKTGDRLRRKIIDAELEGFENTTYLARQIVIDKPANWEYRLTAELLRSFLTPISTRSKALEAGLYMKPTVRVDQYNAAFWFKDRINEIGKLCPALTSIANSEFSAAWGVPGTPGSSEHILRTCKLFTEACQQLLIWEETVRFSAMPSEFENLQDLFIGLGNRTLDTVAQVPSKISKIFDKENVTGHHDIRITIDLPDGWEVKVSEEIQRINLLS